MKIAVFPGSFDPITTGHVDLVMRSLDLFDKIIVAVGINSQKKYLFPLEQRMEWLEGWLEVRKLCANGYEILERRPFEFLEHNPAQYDLRYKVQCKVVAPS